MFVNQMGMQSSIPFSFVSEHCKKTTTTIGRSFCSRQELWFAVECYSEPPYPNFRCFLSQNPSVVVIMVVLWKIYCTHSEIESGSLSVGFIPASQLRGWLSFPFRVTEFELKVNSIQPQQRDMRYWQCTSVISNNFKFPCLKFITSITILISPRHTN